MSADPNLSYAFLKKRIRWTWKETIELDMAEEQLCQFETIECEEERHEKCAQEYEGVGIKALCICTCHDKKEKQPLVRESKLRASDIGWQSELGNFGSDVTIGIRADNK